MTASILILLPALLQPTATQLRPSDTYEPAPTTFTAAVNRYVELRRLLEPHLRVFTADPEQIAKARLAHRDAIRGARTTARRGDVFTPAISAYFRQQIGSTTPDAVLDVLPELPSELVYRVQGRDLVLLDVEADLVVDVLEAAFPPEAREEVEPEDSDFCVPEPLPPRHPSPCDAHGELEMCWS